MRRFVDKVLIVTGAASGIGREIARQFAHEGAVVCCLDRDATVLRETIEAERAAGKELHEYVVDVSESAAVTGTLASILGRWQRVDILVNSAGINMPKRLADLSEEDWDRALGVNVRSVYLMSKGLWQHFRTRRQGTIVNIGSVMGQVGGVGSPAYCVSKAAISMLSRCLAKDGAAYGIRVNTVCPGYIDTPVMQRVFQQAQDPGAARAATVMLQPMGRLGTAGEVAKGVLFLASEDASYISGTELTIDGALTATQIDGSATAAELWRPTGVDTPHG